MLYAEQLKKRYMLIVNYTGVMLVGIGMILLTPLLILFVYRNEIWQAEYFFWPALAAVASGFALYRATRGARNVSLSIQDGGIIVVFSWILAILFSAVPFILSGQLDFTQAVFEATSGWTTTGLSVVNVAKTDHLFLLWRSIMQFFGGAGLAVVMLSAIIGPNGFGLYNAEGRSDRLLPNVVKSTKMIMAIYSGYILAGVFLYVLVGMPWFDAVNNSIAAVSTGGFAVRPDSIGAYHSLSVDLITIILMILGTVNFAGSYLLVKGQFRKFFRLGEVRFMFAVMAFSIPLVAFFSLLPLYGSMGKAFRVAAFETISALTTTGFSTVSYNNWNGFAILIMIVLMLIGGGTGSTAGGIKQYRVYILLKSMVWNVRKFFLPENVVREIEVSRPEGKYYVSKDHVNEISNFVTLYMITYLIGVGILLLYGYSLRNSMFEFASAIGTVGLSVGVTSPTAPPVVLWTETMGMFLGRLEFFVIFYAGIKLFRDIRFISKRR